MTTPLRSRGAVIPRLPPPSLPPPSLLVTKADIP
jgi:hypothetical protein